MNKKINILIILLIFISISAVSASDDGVNDTISVGNDEELSASYSVTSDTYSTYFDSNGYTTSKVASGDTITLSGSFTNKTFVLNKKLTLTGSSTNLQECSVKIIAGGSGSTVSNLKIANTKQYSPAIFLDGASECVITNNNIKNTGAGSYPICLSSSSNNNKVTSNTLETYGESYGHGSRSTPVIVLGSSNYNTISSNQITCADANGIYLSEYGGGTFSGGASYFNTISKNTIKYSVTPTSWAYAIQMMGGNNTADSNTIIGAYRGISSSSHSCNVAINNKLINLTGIDYQTGNLVGGDYGIAISSDSIIRNNTLENCFLIGSGISAGDNSLVEKNTVEVTGNSYGIQAEGNNVEISKNIISTDSGAGVYQQGKFEGVVINNNTINSKSAIGVLIKKSSSKRFPSDITVTNNIISTSNAYAIDASEADKTTYSISNNKISGSSKILTPEGAVDPSEPVYVFNGTTYTITPGNYGTYFDSNGNMASFIKKGDILIFSGTFTDKVMTITEGVKITGKNPVLNNSTIYVTSSDVWIENLTINNKNTPRLNAWGIKIDQTSKVKITNNDISVSDLNAAYAVYVYKSGNVEVSNNKLYSTGNYLTYTLLGLGVDNSKFTNNTISTVGTGDVYAYEGDKCIDGENNIPEIYRTYGILMIRSSENTVSDNIVSVTSLLDRVYPTTGTNASTNSLVGIDFYFESDNNVISKNTITVNGNDNYMYGMGVLGSPTGSGASISANNNQFLNNIVNIDGKYYACGVIIGYGSENTQITSNTINMVSNDVAYAITCELSQESDIENNNAVINSQVIYGIELYASNTNTVKANTIEGNGKDVYGMTLVNANTNKITDNKITSNGNGQAISFTNLASTKEGNAGIFVKGNSSYNLIDNNEITSKTGYAVDLDVLAKNNNITNNYLSSKRGNGNSGVNNTQGNVVKNNYANTFTNAKITDTTAKYLNEAILEISVDSDANGANADFYIDNNYVGKATISSAKAILKITANFTITTHTIRATLTKEGFKTANVTGTLTITKGDLTVKVADVSSKDGYPAPFSATVLNKVNVPVSGLTVKFYRQSTFIGSAITDSNGQAITNLNVPKGIKGTYVITARVDESTAYLSGNGSSTLTISNIINTQIIASNIKMYYKDGTRLVITLADLNDDPIKDMAVVLSVNGQVYEKTTNNNGRVSIALNLNSGNYTVSCEFKGYGNYSSSSNSVDVEILPTLKGSDIVKMYRNGTQYQVTVFDTAGKVLANAEITFNINGMMYKRTTSSKGIAKLNINLIPGSYLITAENPSNNEKISNTIVVKTLLDENYDVTKYYKNATQYTLRVIKQDGNVAGAGEKVTLNINGVLYEKTTNANGYIKMNINLPSGSYIVTATYMGCSVSNNLKIIPVLSANNITMKFQDGTKFKATLVDGQGKVYSGQKVTFNINGMIYTRTTNDSGDASLNINLISGKYIITSSYNGANIANTITIS